MTSRSPSLMRLLPELDRITFGIVNAGKSTDFRIPIGPSFHRDPARPQFRHEPIEIIDAEVDHPLLFCSSKIVGILGERPENCCPCLLLPYGLVQVVDSKILLVPLGEPSRVRRPEEHTTNSNDLRHGDSPQSRRGQCRCRRSHATRRSSFDTCA